MLSKIKTLKGYKLKSLDGEIGTVKEFYFDDRLWIIRYLVANTGNWLTDRQVLLSPYALVAVNRETQTVGIDLTKRQIEDSPSLKTDKPVSRQFEENYYGYYRWPTYWRGPNPWGSYAFIIRDRDKWNSSNQGHKEWDHHLRSTVAVNDYYVQAADGELGQIDDFIMDDKTWAIRYLIVNTGSWWSGKKVLVSTQWIERVSWSDSKVFVNLPREVIKHSPEYREESLPTRNYEIRLHQHYNRKGHWFDQLVDV